MAVEWDGGDRLDDLDGVIIERGRIPPDALDALFLEAEAISARERAVGEAEEDGP